MLLMLVHPASDRYDNKRKWVQSGVHRRTLPSRRTLFTINHLNEFEFLNTTPFAEGRKKAGLEWVTIHDLRHFRAPQWVQRGVDLRTVQELLGHSSITTTMRYAHFAPNHATRHIVEAQRLEAAELAGQKQAKREADEIEHKARSR